MQQISLMMTHKIHGKKENDNHVKTNQVSRLKNVANNNKRWKLKNHQQLRKRHQS